MNNDIWTKHEPEIKNSKTKIVKYIGSTTCCCVLRCCSRHACSAASSSSFANKSIDTFRSCHKTKKRDSYVVACCASLAHFRTTVHNERTKRHVASTKIEQNNTRLLLRWHRRRRRQINLRGNCNDWAADDEFERDETNANVPRHNQVPSAL